MPLWARRVLFALGAGMLLAIAALLMVSPSLRLASHFVDVDVETLPNLEEHSVVRAADGTPLAVLHGEVDRNSIPLDDMGLAIQQAVMVAEDRRFYEHNGYDLMGIARAALANVRAGEVEQGASTISQQVAQLTFLDRERTFTRKFSELLHAVAMERELTKEEILERYLNAVYFGDGAYGVVAAAEEYFRVAPKDLTVEQAALLAAIIRAPERFDPRENPEGAWSRRDRVLSGMAAEGFITHEEATRLQGLPVTTEPPLDRESGAPYAVEAVKREFTSLEQFGDTVEERFDALFAGGYEIRTTLDARMQQTADAVVSEAFPDPAGPTAAIVALDPRSGGIRALHGGADFDEVKFDLATQGRRQPGSALKPVVAAAALEAGVRPDVRLVGSGPLEFTLPETEEGEWEVSNYAGARYGTIDLPRATARSVNTAFAQLSLAVGVEQTVALAERLGVDPQAAFGPPETWGPSVALGGLTHGVTPLELAAVYGAFADHGRLGPPYLIEEVVDRNGEVVYAHEPANRKVVLSAPVTSTMVELLRGVVANGTGTAADIPGWEVIGKTGTTQELADAWFVGATATLSTAVWVGHPDAQVRMPGITGGGLPARLWAQFSAAALEGQEPQPIPRPEPAAPLPEPTPVTVPDLTGMPLGEAMVEAGRAGLIPAIPNGAGDNPSRTVVTQSPSAGSTAMTGENITLRFARPRPPPPPAPPPPTPEPDDTGPDDEGGPPPNRGKEQDERRGRGRGRCGRARGRRAGSGAGDYPPNR